MNKFYLSKPLLLLRTMLACLALWGLATGQTTKSFDDYFSRGQEYYNDEKYTLAITQYSAALRLQPKTCGTSMRASRTSKPSSPMR